MSDTFQVSPKLIDDWALGIRDDVALCLRQLLSPVEDGEYPIIYPPTYAGIGYNIDVLADGTKVALIDSVGSQANRIEPIFKSIRDEDGRERNPYANLVPQVKIEIELKSQTGESYVTTRSLMDVAHRSADATVYASPTLAPDVRSAFHTLSRDNDCGPLCRLAPTSLLFGVWDSRGGSGEKRPRIVRSIVRAWDVEPLHTAAQFSSIRKTLDRSQFDELEKEAKKNKRKLSDVGLDDAPATFRKLQGAAAVGIPEYKDGSPNSERRVLGGVLAKGPIERHVTVNLVALRKLEGKDSTETEEIRRYILSLALIAATADLDLYLREGCHLRFAGDERWKAVPRRGEGLPVDLTSPQAIGIIRDYAETAAERFRPGWPSKLTHRFDLATAKQLIATAEVGEAAES